MDTLEIALIVVGVAWLGIVSLGVLVCVREIALLRARLEVLSTSAATYMSSGAAPALVGSTLPDAVRRVFPALQYGSHYVLLTKMQCGPCAVVIEELVEDAAAAGIDPADVVVLAVGSGDDSDNALFERAAECSHVVFEPQSSAIASALGLRSTPSAILVEEGAIGGTMLLQHIDELARLHARAASAV